MKARVDLQTVELREQTTAAMRAKVEANALREEAEAHAEELEILDQQKTAFFREYVARAPNAAHADPEPTENQSREQHRTTPSSVSPTKKLASSFATGQNQLLDFQNLEAGKEELELAPLDIHRFTPCLWRLFPLGLLDQGRSLQASSAMVRRFKKTAYPCM